MLLLTACSTTQKTEIVEITVKQRSIYKTNSCQDINNFILNSYFNIKLLTKLYNNCQNKNVLTALLIAKGDKYSKEMNFKMALLNHRKALNLINKNNLKLFDEYKLYLKEQISKYTRSSKKSIRREEIQDSSILTSKELEDYIMPRDKNSTRGAILGEFSIIKGIPLNFSTGSYSIEEQVNLSQAKEIGKLLSKIDYKDKIIYITGYTDTRGDSISNQILSMKRAESLKNYLVNNFTIKYENIKADGYGESFPICIFGEKNRNKNEYSCSGEEDYDRSRRVTLEYGQ